MIWHMVGLWQAHSVSWITGADWRDAVGRCHFCPVFFVHDTLSMCYWLQVLFGETKLAKIMCFCCNLPYELVWGERLKSRFSRVVYPAAEVKPPNITYHMFTCRPCALDLLSNDDMTKITRGGTQIEQFGRPAWCPWDILGSLTLSTGQPNNIIDLTYFIAADLHPWCTMSPYT